MIVYKKSDFRCCICGRKSDLTCDHFIPKWTRIVDNDVDNLIPICGKCNEDKGLNFIELSKLKYLPSLYVEVLMRYYRKNAIFLKKYVREFGSYRTNGKLDVERALLVLKSYDNYLEENKASLDWESF